MESILERKTILEHWLQSECQIRPISMQEIVPDASFRRYYRIKTANHSFVAMDAPPPQENCQPFVAIAKALRACHLNAPEIYFADIAQGYLLLSDFGDQTYLSVLNSTNVNELYQNALTALAKLSTCTNVKDRIIPPFTAAFMQQEWAWHKEWFLEKWLGLPTTEMAAIDSCYDILIASAVNQTQVFMHRDFHSGNLMLLANGEVGILDFQDAFIGPVTYDLVSLLRDCYIDWPAENVKQWALDYYQRLKIYNALPGIDEHTFLRWFDLMGIQRHLKVLLTVARKAVRDHDRKYLQYIPRTMNYLLSVTKNYPELSPLHQYLLHTVQPALRGVS